MIQRFIQDDDKQFFFSIFFNVDFYHCFKKMKGKKIYMLRSDNEDYNVFSVDNTF